jgi:plastocyanin
VRALPLAAALLAALVVAGACDRPGTPALGGADADTSLYGRLTETSRGVSVHLVRMVVRGDTAAFEPTEVTAARGDLVRFVMVSSQPETVAFDLEGVEPEVAAYVREHELHHGELLTAAGEVYDVSFRDAPPGRYPFRSVPHLDRGMRGVVLIQ